MGRSGSPENPVSIGHRSWFSRELEVGELEANRSSLGRGRVLGANLLSPARSKHPTSPQPGEMGCCLVLMPRTWWGELATTGDPTVRFSLEVEEEDKLSDLNRLELLGSKTLKGKASSDLSILKFFNKDI